MNMNLSRFIFFFFLTLSSLPTFALNHSFKVELFQENVEGVWAQINKVKYPVLNLKYKGWLHDDKNQQSQRFASGSICINQKKLSLGNFLLPKVFLYQLQQEERRFQPIPVDNFNQAKWHVEKRILLKRPDHTVFYTPYQWDYDETLTYYSGNFKEVDQCLGQRKCWFPRDGLRWGMYHIVQTYQEVEERARSIKEKADGTVERRDIHIGDRYAPLGRILVKRCPIHHP
jgi:hypothetical protein